MTNRQVWQVAKAVNNIAPWTLIGALLRDDSQRQSTLEDRDLMVKELSRHYPYLVESCDVENAWDWFRIYGKDWGLEASALNRGLHTPPLSLYGDWQCACEKTAKALETIRVFLPRWPSEALPDPVWYAFETLPNAKGSFGNSVPPAADYKGTGR
jgi:hypothetical protein